MSIASIHPFRVMLVFLWPDSLFHPKIGKTIQTPNSTIQTTKTTIHTPHIAVREIYGILFPS